MESTRQDTKEWKEEKEPCWWIPLSLLWNPSLVRNGPRNAAFYPFQSSQKWEFTISNSQYCKQMRNYIVNCPKTCLFCCPADAKDCTVRCKWLKWFSEKMMCHPCNWTPSVISTNLQLKNALSDKWSHNDHTRASSCYVDPITEPGTVLWLPRPFLMMRIYCHYNSSVTIHPHGLCSIFVDNKTRWTKCRDAPRITPLLSTRLDVTDVVALLSTLGDRSFKN